MNINDYCYVTLTDAGHKVLTAFYEECEPLEKEKGGKFQLWCLMAIFGPHTMMGQPEPFFVDNKIVFRSNRHGSHDNCDERSGHCCLLFNVLSREDTLMGDMTRCSKCATFHYRNDPCPDDDRPLERTKLFELDNVSESVTAQIPERVLLAINNYVWYAQPTGGFVKAVLINDLMGAVGRADDRSLKAIESICCYVYNAVPSALVGSPERYAKHIANAKMEAAKRRRLKMKTHADFIMERWSD